jgi:hypothetical protein
MPVIGRKVSTAGHIRMGAASQLGGLDEEANRPASPAFTKPPVSITTTATTTTTAIKRKRRPRSTTSVKKTARTPLPATPQPLPPDARYTTHAYNETPPHPNTNSDIKRARKAPLLRRQQYGEELRLKHRRKYLVQQQQLLEQQREQDEWDEEEDSVHSDNSQHDQNLEELARCAALARIASEEEQALQQQLLVEKRKRRSAQALQKMRLEKVKKKAEASLKSSKKRRMEDMANLIRQNNRQQRDEQQGRNNMVGGGKSTTRSTSGAVLKQRVVAVDKDVVVRISATWSGTEGGNETSTLSKDELATASLAAVQVDDTMAPWGSTMCKCGDDVGGGGGGGAVNSVADLGDVVVVGGVRCCG